MKWQITTMGRIYDPGEGSAVYYDHRTGDTHLLTDFAAFLISQLGSQAHSEQDVVETIREHFEADEQTSVPELVHQVLKDLHALDIVQRLP